MEELKRWLKIHKRCNICGGSQGECYKIGNKVYKIFIQFIDEDDDEIITYNKDDILQFSSIVNNTYIFPTDIILVGDVVVGYITDYVDAKSLYKTDPLDVQLDRFEKSLDEVTDDIQIISDNGVLSYDVAYNILYGSFGFKIVDTIEYSRTDIDSGELFRKNRDRFNYEIRLFLIDGYFDKFVKSDSSLYSMCYDPDVNIAMFLKEFRKKLSEIEGYEIAKLRDAKKSLAIRKRKNPKYIRELYM